MIFVGASHAFDCSSQEQFVSTTIAGGKRSELQHEEIPARTARRVLGEAEAATAKEIDFPSRRWPASFPTGAEARQIIDALEHNRPTGLFTICLRFELAQNGAVFLLFLPAQFQGFDLRSEYFNQRMEIRRTYHMPYLMQTTVD